MTTEAMEALLLLGTMLFFTTLAGAALMLRRPGGPPTELCGPGDAWAARWDPVLPISRPDAWGGRFAGKSASGTRRTPGQPRARRPKSRARRLMRALWRWW